MKNYHKGDILLTHPLGFSGSGRQCIAGALLAEVIRQYKTKLRIKILDCQFENGRWYLEKGFYMFNINLASIQYIVKRV